MVHVSLAFYNFLIDYICILEASVHWPQVIRNEDLRERTEQEQINIQIRRCKWGWIGHTLRKLIGNITRYALRWSAREREIKVVLETAGGEPWTMRRQRQAILGKRSKSWPKTEGDGRQFPWTYAPQGVKGNKLYLFAWY